MTDQELLERISLNSRVMPVIEGTRLTVEYILDRLAHGAAVDDLIREYGGLTADDVAACLLCAKESLSDTEYMPLAEAS